MHWQVEIECCVQIFEALVHFCNFIFADSIQGYDKIWFLGDLFIKSSFGKYFQDALTLDRSTNYIKAHYDTMEYYHVSHEDGHDKNILSRVRNVLIKAINCEILLPKVIVVIMNNDLMDAIEHYKPGISYVLGRTLEWLINEFHKIITSHKENLPTKCRKFKYPTFLMDEDPQS